MSDKILRWERAERRSPLFSFMLSLFAPGFGEVYGCEGGRGLFLLLLQSFVLILPLCFIFLFPGSSSLYLLIFSALLFIFLNIYSPLSIYSNLKKSGKRKIRFYNNSLCYSGVAIFRFLSLILSIPLLLSVYSFARVSDNSSYPNLAKGDLVLLASVNGDYNESDLLCFENDKALSFSRMVADERGDVLRVKDGKLLVNGEEYPVTVKSNWRVEKMLGNVISDIVYEKNGRGYFIRNSFKKGETEFVAKKGSLTLLKDDREKIIFSSVSRDDIAGRVEGVVFSKNIYRMFYTP